MAACGTRVNRFTEEVERIAGRGGLGDFLAANEDARGWKWRAGMKEIFSLKTWHGEGRNLSLALLIAWDEWEREISPDKR